MKKINYLLLILISPLLWACEGYLDKPDSDDITVEKAFESVRSARKVLNNLYSEVRGASVRAIYLMLWHVMTVLLVITCGPRNSKVVLGQRMITEVQEMMQRQILLL